MERLIEHFEKNRDSPRELADVANKAFTTIDRGYYTKVAYKFFKNWEDAEDAVQDAYTRLLHAINKGIQIRKFDQYFNIVLRNAINDVFNKRRGMPDTVHPDAVDKVLEPDDLPDPKEVEQTTQEELRTIQQVSKDFNPMYKDIIELRFVHQHTSKEIIEVLGVLPNKVKKCLYKLKKALGEQNVGG